MRQKGFTLVELSIAIAVMSISAGVTSMNYSAFGQHTAKNEAERVAAFIQGHISREDLARRGLWIQVNSDNIQVWYGFSEAFRTMESSDLKAYHGCKYTPSAQKLCYRIKKSAVPVTWKVISDDSTVLTGSGTDGQHYITVEGTDQKSMNVIIRRKS